MVQGWEYTWSKVSYEKKKGWHVLSMRGEQFESLEGYLNDYGRKGWELVSVVSRAEYISWYVLFFKRPVGKEPAKGGAEASAD